MPPSGALPVTAAAPLSLLALSRPPHDRRPCALFEDLEPDEVEQLRNLECICYKLCLDAACRNANRTFCEGPPQTRRMVSWYCHESCPYWRPDPL